MCGVHRRQWARIRQMCRTHYQLLTACRTGVGFVLTTSVANAMCGGLASLQSAGLSGPKRRCVGLKALWWAAAAGNSCVRRGGAHRETFAVSAMSIPLASASLITAK